MKIYRPIKTNWLTQSFGQEKAMVKVDINGKPYRPFIVKSIPSTGIPKGWAGFYTTILNMNGHNGEDWMSWNGEPCYFPVKVENMEWIAKNEIDGDGGIGIDIISKRPVKIDGRRDYVKFRFWHLKESKVYDGQNVRLGDLIALCDSTGASSGHHLHWSMKWCDKDGNSLDKTNGYYGAVDFRKWFDNIFITDEIIKQGIENKIKDSQITLIGLLRKMVLNLQIKIKELKDNK